MNRQRGSDDKLNNTQENNGGEKMNRRIAKKKYKKVLEIMKNSVKTGIGVNIVNQISVDKNGKPCNAMQPGIRLITLKRPRIQYSYPAK